MRGQTVPVFPFLPRYCQSMTGHKQYPFERSREYLFDTLYGGAGVSGCCSPTAGVVGGGLWRWAYCRQSSSCYRSCPDGPTAQICPVGSFKNNALETQHWAIEPAQLELSSGHQLVLGAKEAKVPTNIIAQRSSQSYSEATPGGRYYPFPSEPPSGEERHMVSESGTNGFHFPHRSHTCIGEWRDAGSHWKCLTPINSFNHEILELGPFSPQWVGRRWHKRLAWRSLPFTLILKVHTPPETHITFCLDHTWSDFEF